MRLAESFYGQTSTRQKSGARGLCVYHRFFKMFSDKSKRLRKKDIGLAHQMMDAALIFHVFEANAKLAKLQRVTVTD